MSNLKLGSLFSGSGSFELCGAMLGWEPVWASEIEPFPIRVTHKRFPNMKHLGSVTEIDGSEIEPVDVITFGSPCQDLSIAGNRAGIHSGERSNLFFEAIRIIKEMRDATNGKYPRFAVWENVCFDADTMITCEDGYHRIADIKIGQRVKTLSGEYYPVMKIHQTKAQEVIRLSVSGGDDLIVTPNHPFYARRKIYKKNCIVGISDPEYVPASCLTKEHLIAYRLDKPTLPDNFITKYEAWAIGRWLADGSVDLSKCNPRMFFSIGKGKEDLARKMLGHLPYEIHENPPHPTAINFCFTSKEFYALIADAGVGAANKRVPPYVFSLPVELQAFVLDGYINGDGYVRIRKNIKEISCGTSSRELAYGIARLIRNVYKVGAAVFVSQPKDGMIGERVIKANHKTYTVYAYPSGKSHRCVFDGDILWQPVKGIEVTNKKTTVYNLSVLEDNTYAANDIMVHNCGAFSSNKGEDFRCVLESFCRVTDESISVPGSKKWLPAGCIKWDGASLAWRVYDARGWGVPQRRSRLYLVADFAGECAEEILFKQ